MPNSPRRFLDWPEFDAARAGQLDSSGRSMSDDVMNIADMTADDMFIIDRQIHEARTVAKFLMDLVEDHGNRPHMCGVVCVDSRISKVFDSMNLDSTRLVLLTLLKDIDTADREENGDGSQQNGDNGDT